MALDLFMFADITGHNGLFLNTLDMASHRRVAEKNPLTVFCGFLRHWCLTLGALSKLGASCCQRPQCRGSCERAGRAWKYPRTTSGPPVALCSLEFVDDHSNQKQWAQSMSMGTWPILASSFVSSCLVHHSWHLTNDTVTILPITSCCHAS